MKSSVVFVAETCETCQRIKEFKKSSKTGVCSYLTEKSRASEPVSILKSTTCRFYQMDVAKIKEFNSLLG